MSAKTFRLGITESICPTCVGDDVKPPNQLEAQIEVSASGFAQMLVMKCTKHGPVKKLYSARPDPIFKALYPEFFKELVQAEIIPEPKPTRWV